MGSLGQLKTTYYFSRHLGPVFQSAGVSFECDFADKFIYIEEYRCKYPEYNMAIKQGVLDGLKEIDFDINDGIKIKLLECIEHEVDSSEVAFYLAAKIAIKSLIELKKSYQRNAQ